MVDANRLAESWAVVAAHGDQVPLRFYGRLFVARPELRDLFPMSMAAQRDRLVRALGLVVSQAAEIERLLPFLHQLGREHRRFAATPEHYAAVGEALLDTMADFLGDRWTPELAGEWVQAYRQVGRAMLDGAEAGAAEGPPWWDAEVETHERRTFDVAVLTIRPTAPYPYRPGQSMAVETGLRPRLWRYYSPANAPAPAADGPIELHVRREPGGPVSGALVDQVGPGDTLRLGAPIGRDLTLHRGPGPDLLLLAGGTGLAPLKALVDELAGDPDARAGREVRLFVGARTTRELYDVDDLRRRERALTWLTVVAAVGEDDGRRRPAGDHPPDHLTGDAVDVALRLVPEVARHEVYVCGSGEMVAATRARLAAAGCTGDRVHHESFVGLADGLTTTDGMHDFDGGAAPLESER